MATQHSRRRGSIGAGAALVPKVEKATVIPSSRPRAPDAR